MITYDEFNNITGKMKVMGYRISSKPYGITCKGYGTRINFRFVPKDDNPEIGDLELKINFNCSDERLGLSNSKVFKDLSELNL